ncbi:MAG: Xaa-Pro peptidase family protein [Pseudomonadota bacterium]
MARKNRITSLQERIRAEGLCAALLFYSRDVYYYTGTAQPSYLVVFPEEYFLYVRSGLDFALHEVFIEKDRMKGERRLEKVFKEISSRLQGNKIGIELDVLPALQFLEFKKIFSGFDFVDVSSLVLEQRKRKDGFEIEKIKQACRAVDEGHKAVLSNLKEGVTELELAAAIENAHRLAGHEGIFFIRQPDFFMSRGPISSGPNLLRPSGVVYTITGVGLSAAVPAGPSKRQIVMGDPVVVDIPALVNGYHADQTRTYVLGKAPEKIRAAYESLKEISDFLIKTIRPKMKCSEIYQMALKKSEELRVSDIFLNFGNGNKSRIIGHGVGLELNEPPILSSYDHSEVSEGYVIALDMHMLSEGVGVVKLEDMILIKRDRNEILTRTPRRLFEVE